MSLFVVRSTSAEALVTQLAEDLRASAEADPFAPEAVVIGSRAMERWLRHRIATERGVAAALDFPFPKPALDGAMAWALGDEGASARTYWRWSRPEEAERWSVEGLTWRVIPLIRERAEDAALAPLTRYLRGDEGAEGGAPTTLERRELRFAKSLADVLQRIVHERPERALDWARDRSKAPEKHRWIATLLGDLGVAEEASSPALRHERLDQLSKENAKRSSERPGVGPRPVLRLFGLTALGDGERARLVALSRLMDVHLYAIRTRASASKGSSPIQASLGAAEQKLDGWIEKHVPPANVNEVAPRDAPKKRTTTSKLAAVQAWISGGGAIDTSRATATDDDSFRVDSCHGAVREVEELRDRLLAAFAEDPRLEPRDVLVVTPALGTYAALVEAIFSEPIEREDEGANAPSAAKNRETKHVPAIPTWARSLGTSRTNPVGAALLQALEASAERVTASRLLAFFELEPVRRRFGLAFEDLALVRERVIDSGLRWGLDAEDKAREGQPRRDENTVRFGLERLALGVLVPDEDELFVLPRTSERETVITPLDTEDDRTLTVIGALAGVTRAIEHLRAEVGDGAAKPYPSLARWRELLRELLDELTETSLAASFLRASVDEELETLLRLGAAVADVPTSPRALLAHLEDAFELEVRGERTPHGAVTVVSLDALPSVPFDVVAVLGLDAATFPRGGEPMAWDPFARATRNGEFTLRSDTETDARENDRHLLLQAMLSAREKLWLSYPGGDPKNGEHRPASMPLEECIDALTRASDTERESWVTQTRLQPWARGRFAEEGEDGSRASAASFDARMARAATNRDAVARGGETRRRSLAGAPGDLLPEEEHPVTTLSLDAFADALARPLKGFMRDRLGIYVPEEEEPTPDREPLETTGLDSWQLRDRIVTFLLERLREDASRRQIDEKLDEERETYAEQFVTRIRGEGRLPLAAGGALPMKDAVSEVVEAYEIFRGRGAHLELEPLSLSVGSLTLDAATPFAVTSEREGGEPDGVLQWMHASRSEKPKPLLLAHLHLLARSVHGTRVGSRERFVAEVLGAQKVDDEHEVRRLRSETPRFDSISTLNDLLAIWSESRRRALPLFERTSSAAAAVLAKSSAASLAEALGSLDDKAFSRLLSNVHTQWWGSPWVTPEREDRHVAIFFADFDPVDDVSARNVESGSFLDLAWRVWVPVFSRVEASSDAKPRNGASE